jgi:transcriptional regulator with XRE-family HTH domain
MNRKSFVAGLEVGMTFGKVLQNLREQAGLSAVRLAEMSGVNPAAIGQYERGVVAPGLDAARKLAKGLGVSLTEFELGDLPEDRRKHRKRVPV